MGKWNLLYPCLHGSIYLIDLDGANALINNPAALHKLEAEDDDYIYYLQATNEIVFLSQDGYIRTYFICSGKDYFDRQ